MVSMREVELELCMMQITETLEPYLFLDDDEVIDYVVEDDSVQFFIIGDTEVGLGDRVTMSLTLLFTHDFQLADGIFGMELIDLLPSRVLDELESELYRISIEYQDYIDMFS